MTKANKLGPWLPGGNPEIARQVRKDDHGVVASVEYRAGTWYWDTDGGSEGKADTMSEAKRLADDRLYANGWDTLAVTPLKLGRWQEDSTTDKAIQFREDKEGVRVVRVVWDRTPSGVWFWFTPWGNGQMNTANAAKNAVDACVKASGLVPMSMAVAPPPKPKLPPLSVAEKAVMILAKLKAKPELFFELAVLMQGENFVGPWDHGTRYNFDGSEAASLLYLEDGEWSWTTNNGTGGQIDHAASEEDAKAAADAVLVANGWNLVS